jgi:hypothetical protein
VLVSFSRSVDTNPKNHMMCLPYSNWYPASFCLEAIECTDGGSERMLALCACFISSAFLSQ